MKESLDTIYLQVDEGHPHYEGVTWCQHKINDSDVEYIRRDLFDEKFERVKKLEKQNKGIEEMKGALLEAHKVLSKMNYNPEAKNIIRLHHGVKFALQKAGVQL